MPLGFRRTCEIGSGGIGINAAVLMIDENGTELEKGRVTHRIPTPTPEEAEPERAGGER